ncbi:hypothetical protein [Streptomyces griseofuscus]
MTAAPLPSGMAIGAASTLLLCATAMTLLKRAAARMRGEHPGPLRAGRD